MRLPSGAPRPIETANESCPARAAPVFTSAPPFTRYSHHTESTPRLSVASASSGSGRRPRDLDGTRAGTTTGGASAAPPRWADGAAAPPGGGLAAVPALGPGAVAADVAVATRR